MTGFVDSGGEIVDAQRLADGRDGAVTGGDRREALSAGLPVDDRRTDVAGVATAILEAGEGPPIVVLHGQGGFGAQWVPTMLGLAATHRTLAPDLPGLGASEVPDGPPTPALVIRWLAELIERRCDEPPTLVGVSLGGSIAARFAADRAHHLARLVLVDTGGLGRRVRPAPKVLRALVRHELRPSRRSAIGVLASVTADRQTVERRMGDRWEPFLDYLVDRSRTPAVKRANRRLLREFGFPAIPEEPLRRIAVPSALVWGEHDPVVPVASAEEASQALGWPLHLVEGAGHLPHVEAPDRFVRTLRTILAS